MLLDECGDERDVGRQTAGQLLAEWTAEALWMVRGAEQESFAGPAEAGVEAEGPGALTEVIDAAVP